MDGKEVVMKRDDKEVIALDHSDKQAIASSEKEVIQSHSDKEVISADDKEVVVEDGKEVIRPPVTRSLDVFQAANEGHEVRDHSNGTTTFKISQEIRKNLVRPNEHHVSLRNQSKKAVLAMAKVNTKSSECQINSKQGPWQALQLHDSSYAFFAGDRRLAWEPASVGVDLGQFKLIDAKNQRTLALWNTAFSPSGQIAKIEYFERMADTEMEVLTLAAMFGIQEAMRIAAERDDDYGGGSRKFTGVDPGNSMSAGGFGGGGMM